MSARKLADSCLSLTRTMVWFSATFIEGVPVGAVGERVRTPGLWRGRQSPCHSVTPAGPGRKRQRRRRSCLGSRGGGRSDMAEVVLFHHAHGLTAGVRDFAD